MTEHFARIIVLDTEYEVTPGGLPGVLCLVAYALDERLRHVRTIRLWRGEFGLQPPFDIGPDTLIVGYSLWAELTCFLTLGWGFPVHVYDLHTAYLATTNFLLPKAEHDEKREKPRKGLSDACRAYGIAGWENIDKPQMAKDIGSGLWRTYGQPAVFEYCEEDVRNSTELLRRQLRGTPDFEPANVPLVLHWSEYSAKAIARIQANGMPIDLATWHLVQENKTTIVRELVRRFDPSQGSENPIYTEEGEFTYDRFAAFLIERRIPWPRLASGALDLGRDAFRLMSHIPGIDGIHALRTSLRLITTANLPIGPDGRNRPSLFPFGAATGRNAHRRSLFNCHAAMRPFMKFSSDNIGLYLDYRTQEVGIAAVASGDEALMRAYSAGDIYHSFAFEAGLTGEGDRLRWKQQNPQMRERMKSLYLGISYGMGVPSIARRLERHPLIASGLLELHRRTYPRFWSWREQQVDQAMLTRRMESDDGWPMLITQSPNRNTLYNFPMQSGGAVMLRLAAVRLCEAGLEPSMLIHDGILLELANQNQIEQAKAIMAMAGAEVCNGFEIGVGEEQRLEGGERFRVDKRPVAQALWNTMIGVLDDVGAIRQGQVA
jgi:hypothetical protein